MTFSSSELSIRSGVLFSVSTIVLIKSGSPDKGHVGKPPADTRLREIKCVREQTSAVGPQTYTHVNQNVIYKGLEREEGYTRSDLPTCRSTSPTQRIVLASRPILGVHERSWGPFHAIQNSHQQGLLPPWPRMTPLRRRSHRGEGVSLPL